MKQLAKATIVAWFILSLGINIPSASTAPIFWAVFVTLGLASILLSIIYLPDEEGKNN